MNRADRKENIYSDDVDRQDFLKTLAEACQKKDWQALSFYLMGNAQLLNAMTNDETKVG
jgi:hypothetical protein